MDAGAFIKLYNSHWFYNQVIKKPNLQSDPDQKSPRDIQKSTTLHTRSMSDQLLSSVFSISYSVSPDSILPMPKLNTIFSGKAVTEEDKEQGQLITQQTLHIQAPPLTSSHKNKIATRRSSFRKKGLSKSLSDLEYEELKGFMDLGFVFSEEDKDSNLVSIIPGLQRLGNRRRDGEKQNGDDNVEESRVSRPYLSEAWEVLENRHQEKPLIEWKIPAVATNEIEIKDSLKWWAHSVASTIKS